MLIVYLITIIGSLLPIYLIRFRLFGIPSTALEVLIYLVFVVAIFNWARDAQIRRRLYERRIYLLPAGLILLGAVSGTLIASEKIISLGLLKGFIIDPILVYLLILTFVKEKSEIILVFKGLIVGAIAIALWAFTDAYLGIEGERIIGPYRLDTNASANYLAFALAPVVPIATWFMLREKGKWRWGTLVLILLLGAVLLSGSRAGLVVAVAGSALTLMLSQQWFWSKTVFSYGLISILIVGAFLGYFVVKPDFSLNPAEGGRITSSNNVRWQIWSASAELLQANPLLGTGLGNFQQAFSELTMGRVNYPEFISPRARTAHNLVLTLWFEITILGVLGFFAVLVLSGKNLFRAMRARNELAIALLGAWLVILAHGLVDMPIWKNDGMVLFWILVGLSVTLVNTNIENSKQILNPKH